MMNSKPSTRLNGMPDAESPSQNHSVSEKVEVLDSPTMSHETRISPLDNSGSATKEHAIDTVNTHRPGVTDSDLVTWDGPSDPLKPLNWSKGKKWSLVLALGFLTFCVSLSSSIWSTTTTVTAERFGVSETVMTLGVSLYVLGFALGPLVWGPASEIYGRKAPMFVGTLIFLLMQIPIALAENLPAIFICRFLASAFGSATLAIPPGMAYDLFVPAERSSSVVIYILMVFAGSCLGPIVGGFIMENPSLGWRWVSWIVLILGSASVVLTLFVFPETYEPVLLQRKAAHLRLSTHNWSLHAKLDKHPITLQTLRNNYMVKPLHMVVHEPILVTMTVYNALVYALLYLSFLSYPYIFIHQRHWSPGVASLPFLAILLGFLVSCIIMGVYDRAFYRPRLHRQQQQRSLHHHHHSGTSDIDIDIDTDIPLNPEDRIPPMLLGSLLLPAGLFWLGWTTSAPWPAQVLAGLPLGIGIMLVYLSSVAYVIDVYGPLNANSALAVTALGRSLLAAGFPLFADAMYARLGVGWASSLLGGLCVVLVPVPVGFWWWGERVREWSRFSFLL